MIGMKESILQILGDFLGHGVFFLDLEDILGM